MYERLTSKKMVSFSVIKVICRQLKYSTRLAMPGVRTISEGVVLKKLRKLLRLLRTSADDA